MDVSIVMLTYCHEHYIAKALNSILMQKTTLEYEILVGDDASTDRTPQIIQKYANRHPGTVIPMFNKKNVGASRNLYKVLQRAKGKYIAILEGDDFWLDPQKLQKQWDFLEKHAEYIGCCGKCLVVDEEGRPNYTHTIQFVWNKKIFTLEDYLKTWKLPCQVGALMFRKHCDKVVPWKEEVLYTAHRNVGDKTLLLLLLVNGPIYCSNEELSCYRYVTQKDGKNFFSLHYANPYRNYDMFMYPCRLESWARKRLGISQHLGPRKEYRFCRFVEDLVQKPSLTKIKYLMEMIRHSHQPVWYLWCVLKTLIEMEEKT